MIFKVPFQPQPFIILRSGAQGWDSAGWRGVLSPAVPVQGLMCPEHKEEVTHYCKTCQRLVCQLCRVRRTHTSHKITPVLSAYQALRVRAAGAGLGLCGELGAPQSPSADGGCGAGAAGTTSHHLPAGEADKEPRLHLEQPGHGADPDCRAGGDSEAHGGKGRGCPSVPELSLGRGGTASPVPSGPRTCHTPCHVCGRQVNGSQAKEEVSQLIQGLCTMLEEKRATLLQAIEECQQERLASLHGQIREHQAMLENSGMVGYAQEVLKETDHPCFVQAAKQLHNRYRAAWGLGTLWYLRWHPDIATVLCCRILRATDSLQSFRPAANASFSHFQLDVSRELKLLTDLAFIRGKGSGTRAPAVPRAEAQPPRAERLRARLGAAAQPRLPRAVLGLRSRICRCPLPVRDSPRPSSPQRYPCPALCQGIRARGRQAGPRCQVRAAGVPEGEYGAAPLPGRRFPQGRSRVALPDPLATHFRPASTSLCL